MFQRIVSWDAKISIELLHQVWDGTERGDPLRTVLLEWLLCRGGPVGYADESERYPEGFVRDMVTEMLLLARGSKCRSLDLVTEQMRDDWPAPADRNGTHSA